MPRPLSLRCPARRAESLVPLLAPYQSVVSIRDQWRTRRALRQSLRNLRFAPDEALRDAGWSRAALLQEIAKPIWRA